MLKKFFAIIFVIFILPITANAMQVDKEYNIRVGAMWGFQGERVTFRVSDPAKAEVIRRQDGQYCVVMKEAGDLYVAATFQEADGSIQTKLFLLHIAGNGVSKLSQDNFGEKILQLVNAERQKRNLQPLILSSELSQAAAIRAKEAAKFWSHSRPDGSSFKTAMTSENFRTVGENLNRGAISSEQVVQAWMNSPSHRKNILTPDYREMGIAFFFSPQTNQKYFWAQWFGIRK